MHAHIFRSHPLLLSLCLPQLTLLLLLLLNKSYLLVCVIAQAGVKFGINFTSCSENGNFAIIATTSGIYPKISLLPVLSQINTIASFFKVKLSDLVASCCSRRDTTGAD